MRNHQTRRRPRRAWTAGGILSKLSILIDNNRAMLTVATLIAIYILSGRILSLPWFDENANFLKFLSDKSESLAYLGVVATAMIPIWIEAVNLCNKDNLVGPVLHRALQTRELLYIIVACLVLVIVSPRASYLYMPVVLFTITSFNLARKYFMVTQLPSRSSRKVISIISRITKNVLYTVSMSDHRIDVLNCNQEKGCPLIWESSRKRMPIKARCGGVIVGIRPWVLRLLKWSIKKMRCCSIDINISQSSTIGCEVRRGSTIAVLFIDEPIKRTELLRVIVERAFAIKRIEHVSTLDKFMNSLDGAARKIDKNTTKDEAEQLLMLYDAVERRYDEFLGGKFSSYIPASADIKMFSYVSCFNSQTQNLGGRLSGILAAIAKSSIETGNLPVFSSLCLKIASGYNSAIKEGNFIALSRYDRVCREVMESMGKHSRSYANVDQDGCDYMHRRLKEMIMVPVFSSKEELVKSDVAVTLNRISFLCTVGILCVNLKNTQYADLFEDIVEYIWSMTDGGCSDISAYAINSLLAIQTYILSTHSSDTLSLGGDRYWWRVNSHVQTLDMGLLTELCIEMFDSGFIEKVVSGSGIREVDLFNWEYDLRLLWLTLVSVNSCGNASDSIAKELSAKLSVTDFLAGGASKWEDSAIYMIIEKNASSVSDSIKSLIKIMTLARINVVQDNIKSIALDDNKIGDFRGSINDFVSRSEWVCALESNDAVDASKASRVSSRMLSRSMYLDRRAFANEDYLPGYKYSIHGLGDGLGRGIIDEISKYAFRYCFEHAKLNKCTPNADDKLFNENYIVLNKYAKWEIRRDYFEKAPASKRLLVRCDNLPSGLYVIPNVMIGLIRFKLSAGAYNNSQPVMVHVFDLGANKAAKEYFIKSKIEQGYDEKEASDVADIMLLLRIVCIFEYYSTKESGREIIHIPEDD